MITVIKNAQINGDTVGGEFRVLISGYPYGLGSYISSNKKIIFPITTTEHIYNMSQFTISTNIYEQIGKGKRNYT